MPNRRPLGSATERHADQSARSTAWFGLTLLLGAAAIVLSAYLPAPLLLPSMSLLMIGAGLTIAAVSWLAGLRMGRGNHVAWEIAGALVFCGFAAAMLTDKAEALSALAQIETLGLAAANYR